MDDKFEAICLGSSSQGNAYLMNIGGETILVECGFPKKTLLKKTLYTSAGLENAKACLITHGHHDHSAAIRDVSRLMPTFASLSTFDYYNVTPKTNQILRAGEMKFITENILVLPFSVNHDFPDSLGFAIVSKTTQERILFINDNNGINYNFNNCKFDYIFIECNYVDKLIHIQYNNSCEEGDVANARHIERVLESHMGLAKCRAFLKTLDLSDTKSIFLMHLSDHHANIKIIKNDFAANFPSKKVIICRKDGGFE